MSFALPWALAGLVALPLLLVVYLLRRRGQERPVPALFLWAAVAAPAAGARVTPRRLPPAFWLELAALALLVAAAAGPWLAGRGTRPLLVVLDPTYSMGAGGDASPRREAERALLAALERAPVLRTTLVVASDPPAILGEDLDRPAVERALGAWQAESAVARIDAVLGFAAERGASAVLVLTDGPPPEDLPPSVAWWAFGAPRPNLAIVGAGRRGGVVTLEVANLGAGAANAPLALRVGDREVAAQHRLAAGESWRLRLPVPPGEAVRARLPADALPIDDRVSLPAVTTPPVGVALAGLPERLDHAVRTAIAASGVAELDPPAAAAALEVVLAGTSSPASPVAGRWRVIVHREPAAAAYLGPFAVDDRHPLAAGLAAEGVVWAAGSAAQNPPGTPVIAAGPVALLSDEGRADGGHDLHLRLREDLSTIDRSPLWPVLWWNLLSWRRAELPGPAEAVQRLGEVATLRLPAGVTAARVSGEGWQRELRAADDGGGAGGDASLVRWLPPRPGEYRIAAGERQFSVSVATLQRAESDLRERVSVRRGGLETLAPPPGRRPIDWAVAMAAMALLIVEGALLAVRAPAASTARSAA